MKNLFWAICLVLTLALPLNAQGERSMALAISPLSSALLDIDVLYQLKLSDSVALTVPMEFFYFWFLDSVMGMLKMKGVKQTRAPLFLNIGLGTKFLTKGEGFESSFYLEPRVVGTYGQLGLTYMGESIESQVWGLKGLLRMGWDWFFDSGLYMSLGAGAGAFYLIKNKQTISSHVSDEVKNWILPPPENRKIAFTWDADFKVGYSW